MQLLSHHHSSCLSYSNKSVDHEIFNISRINRESSEKSMKLLFIELKVFQNILKYFRKQIFFVRLMILKLLGSKATTLHVHFSLK